MSKQNIGFIGCGNLALQAIKTLSDTYNIFYSNLSINQAAENLLAEKLDTIDLAKKCDVIFIAVKPNVTAEVLSLISAQLQNQLVISFVAGISRKKLVELAGGYKNIVRTMPSLGIGFKNGPIAISEMEDKALVDQTEVIVSKLGNTYVLEEKDIDAFTAIYGAGPAYFALVAETMSKLAADNGLSMPDKDLASVMFTAGELLQENESAGFAEVQNKVASRKGVTEEALNTMKSAGINEIISQAINNAIERSKKLND